MESYVGMQCTAVHMLGRQLFVATAERGRWYLQSENTLKQSTGRSEDVTDWRDISLFHNSLVKVQRPAKHLWNILIPAPNQQLGPVLLLPVTSRLLPPPQNNT